MPEELVQRARRLAEGRWDPPDAVPASTVVLLRDGTAGLEVLLMRRPASMAFAPGMTVFPGGRVDLTHDARPPVRGSLRLSADPDLARALVVAGVRETFEEAGILLAVDRAGRPAAPDGDWARDRTASHSPGGFTAVLARRRLRIDADQLVPVAHWVTPEVESRRFDTRFLAAAAPPGQVVDRHATETESAHWLTPAEALAENASGALPMLPPTVATLGELAGQRSVVDALQWARGVDVVPQMPRPRIRHGQVTWDLVHAYTGQVLAPSREPAGSEERGLG
jgi:8-oxo-dGTP pyrophosphatase MutT (NUDIX family)